jgi:HNH endonuclease
VVKPYVPYEGPIVTREQAREQSLTRFFPGSRCRRMGHLSQRMVSTGGCSTCLLIHGEQSRRSDPEKAAAAVRASEAKHRDRKRARGRAYSQAHRSESAAARRKRRAVKLAAKLAARVPDPSDYVGPVIVRQEARAAGLDRFYTGKPCVRNHLSQRITSNGSCFQCNSEDWERFSHIRRARETGAEGRFTKAEIEALFQRQRGKCAYCSKSIRKGYHVDHVIPLARGGTNWITNIALACAGCNITKGATDPLIFARRLGRLV